METFLNLKQVYERFGKGYSRQSVLRLLKTETSLIQGVHWLKSPGRTGKILINVKEFQKFIDTRNK